jgi:cytochrome c-type biogenesis protein CcmH/NrfF
VIPAVSTTRGVAAVAALLVIGVAGPPRLAAQLSDSLAGTGAAGRLWDPARAGRPLAPVTAADNSAVIQAIEKRLRCTCGCNLDVYTCRTTDFTCGTSPTMHRRVLALARQGLAPQQIVDAFVREHGVAILMAPPKRGFDLAAYFTPGVVILVAGVLLTLALRRWSRGTRAAAPVSGGAALDASPEEMERLRRELRQLPD